MRVLLVLDEPMASEVIRARCREHLARKDQIAVCYVLPRETELLSALHAQQRVTAALRRALGSEAEGIAVFVATDSAGEAVADYAQAWGATYVST